MADEKDGLTPDDRYEGFVPRSATHTEQIAFVPESKMGLTPDDRYEGLVPRVPPVETPQASRDSRAGGERSGALIGIGGAPTRATTLPSDAAGRKTYPVGSGVLDYFPDAICAIANLSWRGNEQHNPGQPLHWARSKSGDESDTMIRHYLQRGTLDTDGVRHTAKMAWRALAILQKEIEAECDSSMDMAELRRQMKKRWAAKRRA